MLLALELPLPLNLIGLAAAVIGFGTIVFLATHNDYRWVELNGDTIRAKHLYTARIIERRITELECLETMFFPVATTEGMIVSQFVGLVKGIELRFRDQRTPLRVHRADPAMTGAREFIEAIVLRMGQTNELVFEMLNVRGRPLLRQIRWKGQLSTTPVGNSTRLVLGCAMGIVLVFGPILSFAGRQARDKLDILRLPLHEISVQSLIKNGPGNNRHILLTDFEVGASAFERDDAWVALFPKSTSNRRENEIRVIVSFQDANQKEGLSGFFQSGRFEGACSDSQRSNWGGKLGPDLVNANSGCKLSSAWSIDDLSKPPTATSVRAMLWGGASCFVLVILLSAVILRLPSRHGNISSNPVVGWTAELEKKSD